jgi:hypothetical protein
MSAVTGSCCQYLCSPIPAPIQDIPRQQTGDIQLIDGTLPKTAKDMSW